jgi:hypothetical protein
MARPGGAGDSDHLPAAQADLDRAKGCGTQSDRMQGDAAGVRRGRPDAGRRRGPLLEFSTEDQSAEGMLSQTGRRQPRLHGPSVPQHRDHIAEFEHFLETVGDDENCAPASGKRTDGRVETGKDFSRQRLGRLVEYGSACGG